MLMSASGAPIYGEVRYRGYTCALRPTEEQTVLMAQFAGVCRLVWNLALEQRGDHWRRYQERTGATLDYVAQARELTELRAGFDFIGAVHVTPLQRTLKSLDDACRRAWKGLSGYPKPKKRGVHDAFGYAGREVRIEKLSSRWGQVRLPKIGWVRFRLTRPIEGSIREGSVTRTPIGWQVSIGCLVEGEQPDNGATVGIDRGVTVPLMLSDGSSYALPHEIDLLERKHRRAQRVMARRKRGLNRAILNVGWQQIETMLAYKAARFVKVDPAYTSQTCASCGSVDRRSRESRASFVCPACGHQDNADRNAAINILNRGNTPGVEPVRWGGDEVRTVQVA